MQITFVSKYNFNIFTFLCKYLVNIWNVNILFMRFYADDDLSFSFFFFLLFWRSQNETRKVAPALSSSNSGGSGISRNHQPCFMFTPRGWAYVMLHKYPLQLYIGITYNDSEDDEEVTVCGC